MAIYSNLVKSLFYIFLLIGKNDNKKVIILKGGGYAIKNQYFLLNLNSLKSL